MSKINMQNCEIDEDDDIIIPKTFIGELYYIKCILFDIIKNHKDSKSELIKLRRQFYFWKDFHDKF